MTEKTANSRNLLFPAAKAKRHLVDPVAFGLAMVGGPLLTGILGAPALLIPTIATVFGGPIYLLVGVPVMLVALRRQPLAPGGWALLALMTHLALFTPIFLLAWLADGNFDGTSLFLCFGSGFAPLWGFLSGEIYRWLERDFYKQSI
ncbi:MAG: hypothetical protein BM559_03400 [Roseobacter sp. MedPE-SWchi]|nr:MAG: hypothetical protein BM559_03400 [Roseobacter sp. MedPE-SWchi]